MSNQIIAGIDIHKDFLVVTVHGSQIKKTKEYQIHNTDLNHLKRWLARLRVSKVAMEATGIYMIPCCDRLKDRFELYLVNAADVRMLPGKKTDEIDSEWLALLLQKGLLKKSYIPSDIYRDVRELYRQRLSLTQTKTGIKNRIGKVLTQEGFNLSRVYSDIFGRTTRLIIEGLTKKQTLSQILNQHQDNIYISRVEDQLRQFPVSKILSHSICIILTILLDELDQIEQRITLLEDQMGYMTQEVLDRLDDLEILISIPGISNRLGNGIIS